MGSQERDAKGKEALTGPGERSGIRVTGFGLPFGIKCYYFEEVFLTTLPTAIKLNVLLYALVTSYIFPL